MAVNMEGVSSMQSSEQCLALAHSGEASFWVMIMIRGAIGPFQTQAGF
jgi:hypothetical protein